MMMMMIAAHHLISYRILFLKVTITSPAKHIIIIIHPSIQPHCFYETILFFNVICIMYVSTSHYSTPKNKIENFVNHLGNDQLCLSLHFFYLAVLLSIANCSPLASFCSAHWLIFFFIKKCVFGCSVHHFTTKENPFIVENPLDVFSVIFFFYL